MKPFVIKGMNWNEIFILAVQRNCIKKAISGLVSNITYTNMSLYQVNGNFSFDVF